MKCLTCPDTTLAITERSGVEIDYCPTCRGVWLDRGELDKIIERSAEPPRRDDGQRSAARDDRDRDDRDRYERDRYDDRDRHDRDRYDDRDRHDRDRYDERSGPRKKRKGSFLEEIFDF